MDLHRCINFLLSAAQHTVFAYLNEKLSGYGITPAQYGVLNCLWSQGEYTPKQIGERLYLEASSVSSVLDRMQKNDLIDRKIDPDNRRTVLVSATAKGMALRAPVERIVDGVNQEALENFSPEEKEFLLDALMDIAERKLK